MENKAIIEGVLQEFAGLAKHPRKSYHEKAVSDYIVSRLAALGITAKQDGVYNVIADIPATPGYEAAPVTMLQGHMDMVCVAKPDRTYDPLTDEIVLKRDGNILSADGTSLGADDGMAIAISLFLIQQPIVHGPLRRQDLSGIRAMPASLIEEAAMCGLPSVYFLFGALRCMHPSMPVFSYEGPFGVGYGVVLYLNESDADHVADSAIPDIRVRLARQSISYYFTHHAIMSVPRDIPEELTDRAGAFVSLHKGSALRGCIGTFLPMQMNIAGEIIHNAVSAATRDPRFYPVRPEELDDLSISVDILGEPEAVSSPADLDPKKYGVIVMSHARTGLLLPDLEGVDTVEQQIDIAKEKAGIPPQVHPDLYRFTVTRYT